MMVFLPYITDSNMKCLLWPAFNPPASTLTLQYHKTRLKDLSR